MKFTALALLLACSFLADVFAQRRISLTPTRPSVSGGPTRNRPSVGLTRNPPSRPSPSVGPTRNPPSRPLPSVGPTRNPPSRPSPSVGPTRNPPSRPSPSVGPTRNPPSRPLPSVGLTRNPPSRPLPSVGPTRNPPSRPLPSVGPTRNPPSRTLPSRSPTRNPPFPSIGPTRFPSRPSVSIPVPRPVRKIFSCPRECQVCQSLQAPRRNACNAVDDYGDIKNDFKTKLDSKLREALDELQNTGAFDSTISTKSCDGMTRHLKLYAKLTRTVKDKVLDFLADPTTVSANDLEDFPKEIFTNLKKSNATFVYRTMSAAQKAVVCQDLKYTDCITKAFITKRIDCAKALLASGKTLKAKDVSSLLDVNNCSSWDTDSWNMTIRNFPKILPADCIRIGPIDLIMENMDKVGDSCSQMKKRERDAFVNATSTKMREKKTGGTMTKRDKDDLMKIISKCKSDPSVLNGILDAKDTLKSTDLNTVSRSKGMKYIEDALKTMNPSDFTKDEIVNSIGALVNDKKTLKRMNESELEAAACEVCSKKDNLDKRDLRKFADVVRTLPAFSDPSTYDSTTFDCMGCLMPFMPSSSFDKISDNEIRNAINAGNMKNMTITSKKLGKKVIQNAKTALNKPNGDFSEADLKKLGGALGSLDTADLDKIPDNSFSEDVLKDFDSALSGDDSDDKKSLKAKLVDKVAKQAGGISKLMKTSLARNLPTSMILSASISDFPDLTGDNTESTIQVNRKQSKFLMKKVKDTLGDVSSDNFTLKRLSNMKPYLNGFTVNDIKSISQDSTYVDKMNTLGAAPDMSREQVKTIQKQIKSYTKFDSSDSATVSSQTDSSTISQMAPNVLGLYSKAELKKFGTSNCDAIVDRLSELDPEILTVKELQEKFEFFLECIGKTSGTITSDDLDKAGNILGGIIASAADRLDADALENKVPDAQKCGSVPPTVRKKLATNAVSKIYNSALSTIKASGALVLGNLMSELSDTQLNQLDQDTVSDTADKIAEAFDEKDKSQKKREKKGFKMDLTDSEKNNDKANKKRVFKRIIKAKENINTAAASGNSGRRKRSAASLTCTDLQSLGSAGLSALTTTQISNIGDQDFIDCADLLGTPTDYSSDQKDALLVVAKRATVWGDPSNWNASNVYSAGSIAQSLTTSEISNLALDLDATSKLGTFDGWDEAKIMQVFSRWLTLEKSNQASTITSSELRSLGHVVCGASTGHISQIPSAEYDSAADAIGEITSCSDLQLYEYAKLAKVTYGSDVTTWDVSTISNVGIVIGGLLNTEIATLSETQIDSIDANTITYIPPSVFAGFTVNQIQTFDTAQGQATTDSQRSALSTSQLDALSTAAGVSFASSGAEVRYGSVFLTIVLLILATLGGSR